MNGRAILRLRCPRCAEGAVFETFFRARDACPRCGLVFLREPGYWLGAMYFSYGGAVALAAPVAIATWLAGAPVPAICVAVSLWVAALSPWIYRYSRVLWLHFDHRWDPR